MFLRGGILHIYTLTIYYIIMGYFATRHGTALIINGNMEGEYGGIEFLISLDHFLYIFDLFLLKIPQSRDGCLALKFYTIDGSDGGGNYE